MNIPQWPGARWWKFDFHTHTPASTDTEAWQRAKGTSDEVTPERWLLKYMAAEIDCVAVTDHNSGVWIDDLKSTYEHMVSSEPKPEGFRPLTIFPGVEISVNGGLHVLAIFDPKCSSSTITSLLGSVDFPAHLHGETDATDGTACTGNSFKEVITKIRNAGGLVIPAHADKDKGLLTQTSLDALRHALELGVDAIEITDQAFAIPETYRTRNPDWAEVVGSDCHSFQGQAVPGSWYTWIKMAEPTIDGLRLALHDGNGISVRRHDAGPFSPHEVTAPVIKSITIDGFQVMGNGEALRLFLNPFFNALIGGRGTGKSTVIHSLRLALRREDELKSLPATSTARATFERFAMVPRGRGDKSGGGLRPHSSVKVAFQREGVQYLLSWKQDGSGVTIQELDSIDQTWKASTSQTVDSHRFPVRIFSQGQIADLAGDNQQALLDIIDEAAAVGPAKEAWEEAKRSYLAQRAKIREFDGRLAKREQIQVQLEEITRKLTALEGSDHATILKRFQISRQQDNEITHTFNAADELKDEIVSLAPRLVLDDLHAEAFDEQTDVDILRTVELLNQAVTKAQETVNEAGQQLHRQIESLRNAPGTEAWRSRLTSARQAYEKLQDELTAQGITDLSSYGQLVQKRQALSTQLQQLDALASEKAALDAKASEQLQRVHAARAAITQARMQFLDQQLASNDYVRISVQAGAEDTPSAERRLRELIDVLDTRFANDIYQAEPSAPDQAIGLLADWERSEDRITAEARLRAAIVQAASGGRTLGGALCNNLEGRASKDPAFIDRLHCLSFEDGLAVEVSRKGDGQDFRPIQQASAGQRSAAMLAFLLSYGTEPIILDQPEDDLDNHMIYDLIVRQIRENKQRRQLIVVTHNPNIVVNGDAELIHAFDFVKGQCRLTHSGALQERSVREEVCKVMEGGIEAFRRRWQRLGRELR